MTTSIIENLTFFGLLDCFKGLNFLEIEKTFGNKKVANNELTLKGMRGGPLLWFFALYSKNLQATHT